MDVGAWAAKTGGIFALGLGLGCLAPNQFVCDDDNQCQNGDVQGFCEMVGVCSFPDDSCDSGRRYGTLSEIDVAGQCVGIPGGSTGADATSGSDSAGSASGASSTTLPDPSGGSTSGTTSAATFSTTSPTSSTTGDDTGSSGSDSTASDSTTSGNDPVTVSFGDGNGADVQDVTRDTFVTSERPGDGAGGHDDFHFVDGSGATALLAFDLTAIPSGVTILDAELQLSTEEDGVLPDPIEVFELFEDWTEGNDDLAAGHANWNERMDGVAWTTPGAGPGSRDTTVLATFTAAELNTTYTISIPTEVIQGWVDDASTNFGLAMTTGTTSNDPMIIFWTAASENPDQDERPLLTVTYQP